jgi:endonuclease YncB( thermonuclease family)
MRLKALLAVLFVCGASPALAETISGRASVISGDTIEVHGERIRLFGIEAPDSDLVCERTDDHRWRCGHRAANALEQFLEESIVACIARERETTGRVVALCSANGVDLGLWLVRNGFARDAPDISGGRYRQAQEQAKALQKGIWSDGRR